jgi:hypothetical protein
MGTQFVFCEIVTIFLNSIYMNFMFQRVRQIKINLSEMLLRHVPGDGRTLTVNTFIISDLFTAIKYQT